jgi:uncharacterized protein (DUF2267 family)
MGFRELIKKMQVISGFSDKESKEALEHMVECLAVRLTEGERKDFASQLPSELQSIALSVYPSEENYTKDLIKQFMEDEQIDESRAKKQILCAWQTLKSAISPGEIDHIKAQLPGKAVALLH